MMCSVLWLYLHLPSSGMDRKCSFCRKALRKQSSILLLMRCTRISIDSFNHHFFNFLERKLPQAGGWRSLTGKVLITQCVINPFIYLPLFFTWTGLARGHSFEHIADHLQREAWTTLSATWMIFTPVNVFNYSLTPVRHQANISAMASFIFNIALSVVQSRSIRVSTDDRQKPIERAIHCDRFASHRSSLFGRQH